ncbi:MAG: RHS repeat protein [Gammaproteobacteria bacterium]|nr:RHS repeat protein [Gammaproteobacteria bacterium]
MTLLIGLTTVNPAWAGSADYVYDNLGRLIAINYDDGTTITYSYDNTGNRITRTVVKL